jgi:hypothetical protein
VVSSVHAGGKRVSHYFAKREGASAEAETLAPRKSGAKEYACALGLAVETSGVFTKSGKGFRIFGK